MSRHALATIKMIYLLVFMSGVSVAQAIEIDARVNWAQKVELRIPVTGIITTLKVEAGQLVKRKDLLIALDDRVFKANVRQQQADVKLRKLNLEEAKRELDRMQQLYDRTMLSEHDLQMAKNHVTEAESAWINAKSGLTRARVALDHSQLRAPFDAIVLKKNAELGQAVVVGEGQPSLLTLAASNRRVAVATVASDTLTSYEIGKQVDITAGSKSIPGKITGVNLLTAKNNNQVELIVEFTVSDTSIMPGSGVKINIP